MKLGPNSDFNFKNQDINSELQVDPFFDVPSGDSDSENVSENVTLIQKFVDEKFAGIEIQNEEYNKDLILREGGYCVESIELAKRSKDKDGVQIIEVREGFNTNLNNDLSKGKVKDYTNNSHVLSFDGDDSDSRLEVDPFFDDFEGDLDVGTVARTQDLVKERIAEIGEEDERYLVGSSPSLEKLKDITDISKVPNLKEYDDTRQLMVDSFFDDFDDNSDVETVFLTKKIVNGQLDHIVMHDEEYHKDIALKEGVILDTEPAKRVKDRNGNQVLIVHEDSESDIEEAIREGKLIDYTDKSNGPTIADPKNYRVIAMNQEEYQRFYQATYNSLQDLVNLHKALKENHKKIQAGEQIIDPSRVKVLANVIGKKKAKESKGKEHKQSQERKAEADKQDIENIAKKKARQKEDYLRYLDELEIMFQVIHTTNRNRKDREKLDIKNRAIKLINNHQLPS
ncbi:MAG: hypothetical protein AAGG81_05980 [Chlamydiota bacterium]